MIDSRNGETFYVGKGKGIRVFSHINGEIGDDELTDKVFRIRGIKLTGFDVAHVIHRHGMDENIALEVEFALIDTYPGPTNIQGGLANSDRWICILKKYSKDIQLKQQSFITKQF